jgi:transposase
VQIKYVGPRLLREIANPGARPHPATAALEGGLRRHDDSRLQAERHATLFAALDVKTGEVIGECMPRHRAKEFIRFLKKIDRVVAKSLDLHLILDNYKTHKTKEVQAWLAKHPRFKLHFTPTFSSPWRLQERS